MKERQGNYVDEFGETIDAIKTLNYNKWDDNSYMITVNADDGIPFSGNEGAVVTLKVKAEETAELGLSTIPLQNMELVYANGINYSRPMNTVCMVTIYQLFDIVVPISVGGTVKGSGTYESGDEVTLTAVPDEGYRFIGWSDGKSDNPYTFDLTETKELKATFEPIDYNLIYLLEDVEYKRETISYGSEIIPSEVPNKEGFTFGGWEGLPETMPACDIIVTGSYIINKYTLIYSVDGVEYKKVELDYGSIIPTEESPTKEGHTFSGWSEIPEVMPANDVTITGRFTANVYTVTYILDDEVFKTEEVTFGTAVPTPEVPAREGYNFSGWGEVPATMPAEDLTFRGSYFINKDLKYNLIYLVDGVEYERVVLSFGDAIVLEASPTKEGHTFSGWSEVPATMPLHDVTVSGTFTANSYRLTYVLDGETFKTEQVTYGTSISTPEAPSKEGYTFSGWTDVPTTMPAHDVTVTGSYSINSYTLLYIIGGVEYKKVELDYGSIIPTEESPMKEGHTFSGWSEIPEVMPANDVTITGRFTANVYTVTYLVDGEVYATEEVVYGEPIVLIEYPTKEGYTFSGWSEVPESMPAYDIEIAGNFELNLIKVLESERKVDVYTLEGVRIKIQLPVQDIFKELQRGIYLIEGQKVVVK